MKPLKFMIIKNQFNIIVGQHPGGGGGHYQYTYAGGGVPRYIKMSHKRGFL